MLTEDTTGENNSNHSQNMESQVEQVIVENEVVRNFINKSVDKIRSVFEMLKRHNTKLDIIINSIKAYNNEDGEKINKTKKIKYDEYIEIKNIEDWTAVDSKIILTSI